MIVPKQRPRVVVVGAGFSGLWTVRTLARSPVEVLLVDRNNYHTFNPMLYQVVAAIVGPEQITYPVRSLLRKQLNADLVKADVKQIDFANRVVETDGPRISYDFLVLATGSITQFFNVPGASENAFPLDNLGAPRSYGRGLPQTGPRSVNPAGHSDSIQSGPIPVYPG